MIDGGSFATQKAAIDEANASGGTASVLVGGGTDDSEGWFVEPTVIETSDPGFRTMREELFGPVVTAFVYDENRYEETLDLVDSGAPYGLTGAVFARDLSRRPGGARRRSATRPGTSTSTTSRPAPSSASSRSAAPAPRARTTRPARCGT